jgi:hypothetical protein
MITKIITGVVLTSFLLIFSPSINAIDYQELKETYDDSFEKKSQTFTI